MKLGKDYHMPIIKISYILIAFWCIVPSFMMILYFLDAEFLDVTNLWELFMHIVGYVGLILGIVVLCSYKSSFGIDLLNEFNRMTSRITKCEYNEIDKYANLIANDNSTNILKDFLPIVTLLLFLLWTLLSCCYSPSIYMAFNGDVYRNEGYFTYIAYAGFVLLGLVISNDIKFLKRIALIFVFVGGILSILMLLNDNHNISAFTSRLMYDNYHSSVFYNSNHFAYYLLLVTTTDMFLFLCSGNRFFQIVYALLFVTFVITIIVNNTFGVFLALIITLAALFVFELINNRFGVLKVIVIVALFLSASGLSFLFTDNILINIYTFFGDISIFGDYMNGSANETDIEHIGTGRGKLWTASIYAIANRPILGYGLDSGADVFIRYDITIDRPHNMLLQMALFTGIPGAITYYSTYIIGAVRLIKKRFDLSRLAFASIFIIVAYIISSMFGNSMYYTSPYFLITFGVCLNYCIDKPDLKFVF